MDKNFDKGVHDHDVLVDLVHIPKGGKMQISPKLELCRANQAQIRNQRPRLRRNTLFLGRKTGGYVNQCQYFIPDVITHNYIIGTVKNDLEK